MNTTEVVAYYESLDVAQARQFNNLVRMYLRLGKSQEEAYTAAKNGMESKEYAMSDLSNCHQAPLTVSTADEGTSIYICTECKEACDVYVPDNTAKLRNDVMLKGYIMEALNITHLPISEEDQARIEKLEALFTRHINATLEQIEGELPKIDTLVNLAHTTNFLQGFEEGVDKTKQILQSHRRDM